MGLSVFPVKAGSLQASGGATDFGEYFLYFSFFLVISALLLAGLFFKLGVEHRLTEIGLLRALGFAPSRVRTLFLSEGCVLAILGSIAGAGGAVAYGFLVMHGLRTWWVNAVGTTHLQLHLSFPSLAIGGLAGIITSAGCIAVTLKTMTLATPRSLLTRSFDPGAQSSKRREWSHPISARRHFDVVFWIAVLLSLLGCGLLAAAARQVVDQVPGFFGAGTLLLGGLLGFQSVRLRRPEKKVLQGMGWLALCRLGFRNDTYRPGRSILCLSVIAFATFIIVAVDAFRREGPEISQDKRSGTGGYSLLAESVFPLYQDPNTAQGRAALRLSAEETPPLRQVTFTRFRVRPGEDASCLNLYQPRNPRILAPTDDFIKSGRFTFQDSLASTPEEKQNPWLLLQRDFGDGTVPVMTDANSARYVLHLAVGDEFMFGSGSVHPLRFRLVGTLADSLFQSELLMSEKYFLRLFPEQQGYRFFLLDVRPESVATVSAILEERLADFGFDAVSTAERIAAFHRVENTYLACFRSLGGLGLMLGTVGLAAVLLRNILERRRELALLRAVGYAPADLAITVAAENGLLLLGGVITGTVCALLAVVPPLLARHSSPSFRSMGILLLAVVGTGMAASVLATVAALRSPLLPALRAE